MGFATLGGDALMSLGMAEVAVMAEVGSAGAAVMDEAGVGEPMVRAGQDLIGARPTEAPTQ